jgi:hypothetical protein
MKKLVLFLSITVTVFVTSCRRTALFEANSLDSNAIAEKEFPSSNALGNDEVIMEWCGKYKEEEICDTTECNVNNINVCAAEITLPSISNLRPIVRPTGTNIVPNPMTISLFTQLFKMISVSTFIDTKTNNILLKFKSINPGTAGQLLLVREASYQGGNKFVSTPLQTTSTLSVSMLQTTINNPTLTNLRNTIGQMYKPLKISFTYGKVWF